MVLPDAGLYLLKTEKESNLNSIYKEQNIILNKKQNFHKSICFSDIKELKNNSKNKVLKMDIEGIEEEIIIKNLEVLKNIKNLTLVFEVHQSKYSKSNLFFRSLDELIKVGFKVKFVELALFCNQQLLKLYELEIIDSHYPIFSIYFWSKEYHVTHIRYSYHIYTIIILD